MTRLDEIAREHYEAAVHAGRHLAMSGSTFGALRRGDESAPAWGLDSALALAALTGIPVVVDESLPAGAWQLVEKTRSGDVHVIEQGEVNG